MKTRWKEEFSVRQSRPESLLILEEEEEEEKEEE
jgi:hypothetical protein